MSVTQFMTKLRIWLLFPMLWPVSAAADDILVAAASNFSAPMARLVEIFEQDTGHRVQVAFGSSGRLFAQISNGAPFQLFFSADQDKPQRLQQAGLAVDGSDFTYATGTLVLWAADENMRMAGPELLSQSFNYLAIANPALAPYGQAAVEVLENLEVAESTRSRWVMGENIAQAYQFVETANAEIGFVALSQVVTTGGIEAGRGWIVPANYHAPIRQDVVQMQHSEGCIACTEFLNFVKSEKAQQVITDFGYNAAQN